MSANESATHRAPSVGSVTKKIMDINPNLTVSEVIGLVRQAIRPQGSVAGEFASAEVIDEKAALELARATIQAPRKSG